MVKSPETTNNRMAGDSCDVFFLFCFHEMSNQPMDLWFGLAVWGPVVGIHGIETLRNHPPLVDPMIEFKEKWQRNF